MMLTTEEAFALTEQRKQEWTLLGVRLDGSPTYSCPGCRKKWITVVTRGAAMPATCPGCSRPLRLPECHDARARAAMVAAGHENLLGGSR